MLGWEDKHMNEIVNPEALLEGKTETFFGGCPHDCPDTCSMLFEVKDGELLSVRGKPVHPMTRGGLWEVVAVPDIRRQVWDVARRLANAQWVGGEGL